MCFIISKIFYFSILYDLLCVNIFSFFEIESKLTFKINSFSNFSFNNNDNDDNNINIIKNRFSKEFDFNLEWDLSNKTSMKKNGLNLIDLFNALLNDNNSNEEFEDYFIDGVSNFDDFSPLMKLRILKKLILNVNNDNNHNNDINKFKDIVSKY
jgi:hypothetical protein